MSTANERLRILERLEKGEISPDEAARLLESGSPAPKEASTPMEVLEQLERGEIDADQAAAQLGRGPRRSRPRLRTYARQDTGGRRHSRTRTRTIVSHPKHEPMPDFDESRRWWLLVVAGGVLVTALSAWWMRAIVESRGVGLLFMCAWAPMLLGLLLIIIGWASQYGTWLHVRVHPNQPGAPHRIAVSLPLPLGLASWFMRTFGVRIEGLDHRAVDEILMALENSRKAGEPLYIEVDNPDGGGEHVEVYIG